MLSHELRTPLTPVVMAVQTLGRRHDLPEDARDALAMIRRNIKIESHLIDDLLDLTRIARGHLEIVAEPMNVHAAVMGAVEICESDIRAKNQTLKVDLDASEHQIHGDFNRLQQVVWNLLKNASKFTRRGGDIRVNSRNDADRIIVGRVGQRRWDRAGFPVVHFRRLQSRRRVGRARVWRAGPRTCYIEGNGRGTRWNDHR